MGRFLGFVATILIVALAAAFAAPYLVNWNDYREVFETQAGKLIGRKVSVGGDVSFVILPTPQIRFQKFRVAGADGGFDAPFLEADSFSMTLSLPSLMSGVANASSVTLKRPVLRLATDAAGRGDWGDVGSVDPSIFVAPREVTLGSVVIEDGRIEFRAGGAASPFVIDAIAGEFSAEALQGPYKFTGGFGALNRRFEIRLASGRIEGGEVKLRSTWRTGGDGPAYQIEGALGGFDGPLRFAGGLSMQSALPPPPGGSAAAPVIEVKTKLFANLRGARFEELSVFVPDETRPQSLAGRIEAAWGEEARLSADLRAEWLDAGGLVSAYAGDVSLAAAPLALPRLFAALPFEPAAGRLQFTAGQLSLGGDALRDVRVDIVKQGGAWRIADLRALGPGDSEMTISGEISQAESGVFRGRIGVNGPNLGRFLRWAAQDVEQEGLTIGAQNFALSGDLSLSEDELRLASASGEWGGSSFRGELRYSLGAEATLALTLDSDSLDLRPALSADFSFGRLQFLMGGRGEARGGAAGLAQRFLALKKATLALRIGRLLLPGQQATEIRADIENAGGALLIRALDFTGDGGLRLSASGRLDSAAARPDGELKLSLEAAEPNAVAGLLALLGAGGAEEATRAAALAPLKLAGGLTGRAADAIVDFKFDGLAAESSFSIAGRFTGETDKVWDGAVDVEGWLSNKNGAALLRQFGVQPDAREDSGKASAAGQSLFTLTAKGPLAGDLDTKISLRAPQLSLSFAGSLGLAEAQWRARGAAAVKADAAQDALAMLDWLPRGARLSGPLSLEGAVERSGGVTTIRSKDALIGGAVVSGEARIDHNGPAPAFALTLDTDNADLPALLAAALAPGAESPDALGDNRGDDPWPAAPFSQAFFAGPRHSLTLKTRMLAAGHGLAIANAALELSLEQGRLTLVRLEGAAFGGQVSAQGAIESRRGVYALSARLKLDNARLEQTLAGAGKPLATGSFSLDLRLAGEGASPRGVASALSGRGVVSFGDGVIHNFAPDAIGQIFKVQADSAKPVDAALGKQIAAAIRKGDFPYRKFRAAIRVRNGAAQVKRASFRGRDSTARAEMIVDAASLRVDCEWRLGLPNDRRAPRFPPVRLIFAGPLTAISSSQGALDSDEFERFLAVRKMERDVERLETLSRSARPPEEETPSPPGPRRREQPKPAAPGLKPREGAGVERQSLPPLPPVEAAAPPPADAAAAWRARPEPAPNPLVIEKPAPGDFERRMRAVIQSGPGQPPPAADPPAPATAPPPPSPPPAAKPPAPREPFDPFGR